MFTCRPHPDTTQPWYRFGSIGVALGSMLRERAECAMVRANIRESPEWVKARTRYGRQDTVASGGQGAGARARNELGERGAAALRAGTRAARASEAPKSAQPTWLADNIERDAPAGYGTRATLRNLRRGEAP